MYIVSLFIKTSPKQKAFPYSFFFICFFNSHFIYLIYFTVTKQVQTTYINHARWHRCLPASMTDYNVFQTV